MVTLIDAERPGSFSRWDSDRYFEDIRYELDLFRYHMAHSFIARSAYTSTLRELWRTTMSFQEAHDFPSDADVVNYFRCHFPVFHLKDDLQRYLALTLKDTRKPSDLGHNYRLVQEEFRLLFHVVLSRIICSSMTTHFFGSCSACDDDDYLDRFERSLWGGAIHIQWTQEPTWRMMDVSDVFIKTSGSKPEACPINEAMARRICKTLEGPYFRPYAALIGDYGASSILNQRLHGSVAEAPPSGFRPAAPAPSAPLILSSPMPPIQFLSIYDDCLQSYTVLT
ncbi:hypothetical protein FB451DRAFT_1480145 [Mycena latifolia]|nr:hypothetical protein FB451DRAFT_1480145 [Mycena latifolia]